MTKPFIVTDIAAQVGCLRKFSFSYFREIFNFVFREITLEFREISRKTKSKFGRNFRNFAKLKHNFGNIFAILQKEMIFNLYNVKKIIYFVTYCSSNLNGF